MTYRCVKPIQVVQRHSLLCYASRILLFVSCLPPACLTILCGLDWMEDYVWLLVFPLVCLPLSLEKRRIKESTQRIAITKDSRGVRVQQGTKRHVFSGPCKLDWDRKTGMLHIAQTKPKHPKSMDVSFLELSDQARSQLQVFVRQANKDT